MRPTPCLGDPPPHDLMPRQKADTLQGLVDLGGPELVLGGPELREEQAVATRFFVRLPGHAACSEPSPKLFGEGGEAPRLLRAPFLAGTA